MKIVVCADGDLARVAQLAGVEVKGDPAAAIGDASVGLVLVAGEAPVADKVLRVPEVEHAR